MMVLVYRIDGDVIVNKTVMVVKMRKIVVRLEKMEQEHVLQMNTLVRMDDVFW